jgi:hypothetical protein
MLHGSSATFYPNRNRPKTDPKFSAGERPDGFGVMLTPWLGYAPHANAVFTPEEMEARIAWHAARVEREQAELPPLRADGRHRRDGERKFKSPADVILARARNGCTPDGRDWGTVKVVTCGGCRKVLLGRADEYLRRLCVAGRGRRPCALPPPVACRDAAGRSLCRRCSRDQ